jgi:enamine deaminase RidA (YjgF/YER057c/UK114 family)
MTARRATREIRNLGTAAERSYGYSQAVRCGPFIFLSGQTAWDEDGAAGGLGDVGQQMRAAYAKVQRLLAMYGASMQDVVDETLFVTDIEAAIRVAADVRREAYGGPPETASTLCEVSALGAPGIAVEIKCIADASGPAGPT